MRYLVKRTDQGGGFLAPPPINGWVKNPVNALVFTDREKAEAECCPGNEIVVELDNYLKFA